MMLPEKYLNEVEWGYGIPQDVLDEAMRKIIKPKPLRCKKCGVFIHRHSLVNYCPKHKHMYNIFLEAGFKTRSMFDNIPIRQYIPNKYYDNRLVWHVPQPWTAYNVASV